MSDKTVPSATPAPRLPWRRRFGLAVVLLLPTLWASAALAVDVRVPWLRLPLAALYVAAVVAVLLRARRARQVLVLGLGGFLLVLGWWLCLEPPNAGDWQADVAVLPFADLAGDQVTLHNIRNCDYRSETDYDVRHYDRTLDLTQLESADLFLVYWGSPHIAHTMMSFGFRDGSQVCISVETRKRKGQTYSTLLGFYRQFTLTYVVADERDLVRLRTNYRAGEEVYLYRLNTGPELIRQVFLDYLKQVNALHDRAEWYNAITSNCTTNIRGHTAPYTKARWRWQVLLTGHVDEMAYANGALFQALPFAELKVRSRVNAAARAADQAPDFSRRIRDGLPGITATGSAAP